MVRLSFVAQFALWVQYNGIVESYFNTCRLGSKGLSTKIFETLKEVLYMTSLISRVQNILYQFIAQKTFWSRQMHM